MMKLLFKIFGILLLFICSHAFGQWEQYSCQRELSGITGKWHKIILPDEMFGKVSPDLDDIRIMGVTANDDTVEAPYLLRSTSGKKTGNEIACKVLNTAKNAEGHYFTFEVSTPEPINQITPHFKLNNFDRYVKLEGSQDQQEWFTLTENYRILSINNENTDYRFTTITFPDAKYRFYRLLIAGKENPELTAVNISRQEVTEAEYNEYQIEKFNIRQNRESKQTEIDIELKNAVPVNFLKLDVKNAFDFYRPITIQYLTDSVKTEKGWYYNFRTLTSGTLTSIDTGGFTFAGAIAQKLKIFVDNFDNQPLTIQSAQVKGYRHELTARFDEEATYYLLYGNKYAEKPIYDIERFSENLPGDITPLQIGNELLIQNDNTTSTEPLFKNRAWLWVLMGLIIIVMGYFSLKMMKST